MSSLNWKQFTRRISIKAPAKAIYEAWTTQQGLENWFLRLAHFKKEDGGFRLKNHPVETGDSYLWLWHGYDDTVIEEREVLLTNGWDQFKFNFSGACVVTVTINRRKMKLFVNCAGYAAGRFR